MIKDIHGSWKEDHGRRWREVTVNGGRVVAWDKTPSNAGPWLIYATSDGDWYEYFEHVLYDEHRDFAHGVLPCYMYADWLLEKLGDANVPPALLKLLRNPLLQESVNVTASVAEEERG